MLTDKNESNSLIYYFRSEFLSLRLATIAICIVFRKNQPFLISG